MKFANHEKNSQKEKKECKFWKSAWKLIEIYVKSWQKSIAIKSEIWYFIDRK